MILAGGETQDSPKTSKVMRIRASTEDGGQVLYRKIEATISVDYLPEMTHPRRHFTLTHVQSADKSKYTLVAIGGAEGSLVEIYDSSIDKWSDKEVTGGPQTLQGH